MKTRLIAGTINRWPDEDGWRNYHLDINPRPIWDRTLSMSVLPDFVVDLAEPNEMAVFREGTFDEVRLHHVLEHMAPPHAQTALNQILRILTADGILDVEVPDIENVIAAYVNDALDFAGLSQWIYGEWLEDGHRPADTHLSAWTASRLRSSLIASGFVAVDPVEAGHAARFLARKGPA